MALATYMKELNKHIWNLQNFSVTQILREIKVSESRDSKYAILTLLEALNFDYFEILPFLKAEI